MAHERKKPEEPNELRWLTTYADVVTLLMAFFVMLYAISQVDQTKFQLFVSGLADPFDNPAVSEGLLASGTGFVGADMGDGTSDMETFGAPALLDGLPELLEEPEQIARNENVDPDPGAGGTDPNAVVTDEQLLEVRDAISASLEASGLVGSVDFELTSAAWLSPSPRTMSCLRADPPNSDPTATRSLPQSPRLWRPSTTTSSLRGIPTQFRWTASVTTTGTCLQTGLWQCSKPW